MVLFEKINCKLLTGEYNYTGGIKDPNLEVTAREVEKKALSLRECLDYLKKSNQVDEIYDRISDDYFTCINAILRYNERVNEQTNN